MTCLYLDDETYCETPITAGTHRYAEGAEVMLRAWAIDDGPVSVWDVTTGDAAPRALVAAINDPDVEVWAHNSHFDRTVERHAGYTIELPRWRDTMVQALAHGLPGALGQLCDILGVPTDKAKDKAGKALIQLFCKPRPATAKIRRATRETHPADWQRFIEYAALDIDAMREVRRRLPTWNYQGAELALWHLDQRINDRGVAIDLELAECAVRAVDGAQVDLAARTVEATNGEVQTATQRDAMLLHVLQEYGVDLPNLQMATLERRIADPDLPGGLRELLQIRLQASTTSTSKYKTLMKGTSSDGRLRGLLQFCGASRTGRWAGRLFQPQNLPRPTLKQEQIDQGIDALKAGCADLLFPNVMQLTSSSIRGCIVAPADKKLVVADLSNIEGRVQAWLATERWKLKAFRDFDAGTGPDLYKLAYGKSFGIKPEDVTKDQRQVGKVQELALGYEGGVGAFVTFAAAYGIDLEQLAMQAAGAIPGNVWGQAHIMLEWHRKKGRDPAAGFGLSERAWLTCESFKLAWRDAHQNIAALWKELDETVRTAVDCPGRTFPCQMLKIRRDGNWLRIGLPSGRAICYPSPQIEDGKITYVGVNQYSRKWCRLQTYGGKIFENICQAVARDVMAVNMQPIEDAGYAIVLSVHDELLTEVPDSADFNAEHLSNLLATNPPWAPDMPLAAAGFETTRYKKD
ncbi:MULTISPECIES: DNA polymerase [unclassified Janthinobacterium]|uniref:DNA polymerase n=1 Tax=unclassified Janthinobacterium TaxID=2610881 RepID=UPI00034601D3|nr:MULTISPECIES: DNA polymerase [unclassified Janthinobacterium]MEC5161689.1 DNA polymerase [Janthinobacterium sp. CG_S6]